MRTCIGIDRGATAVRVAWRMGSRWHWASQALRMEDAAPTAVGGALRTLLRPLQRLRDRAQIRVTAPPSHVRTLEIRVADLAHLPTVVRERLAEWVPFDPARCHYQYRLLTQRPADGQLVCTLQLAACDAQALEQDLGALQQLGWIPSHVYPAALAVAALAVAQGKGAAEPVVVVELGARRSLMALLAHGEVLLAREPALGSDHLTEALMGQVTVGPETIHLSWEEAERLKCQYGMVPEEEAGRAAPASPAGGSGRLSVATYRALIAPVLGQWLEEIRRTIAFGTQDYPEGEPRRVLLCGFGAQLHGLEAWLSQGLGLPVEHLAPASPAGGVEPLLGRTPAASGTPLGPDGHRCGQDRPDFATVCGLLLADEQTTPNLLPERSRRMRRLIRWERAAMAVLIGAALSLWAALGGITVQQRRLARQQAMLQPRWQALEPARALAREVAAHTAFLTTLDSTKEVSPAWLSRLADGFPDSVRLQELHVKANGEVRLVGQAQERGQSPEAAVSALGMWLEHATVCGGVRFGSSQRDAQEAPLVEFSLTCQAQ